jgi:hypothetical protein
LIWLDARKESGIARVTEYGFEAGEEHRYDKRSIPLAHHHLTSMPQTSPVAFSKGRIGAYVPLQSQSIL